MNPESWTGWRVGGGSKFWRSPLTCGLMSQHPNMLRQKVQASCGACIPEGNRTISRPLLSFRSTSEESHTHSTLAGEIIKLISG